MRRSIVMVLMSVLIAAMTAACAGRPKNLLFPAGDVAAPGAARVSMLVATTRNPQGALPGQIFTGERGRQISFADITVSIPPDSARKIGEVQWPKQLPANPATDFVTISADVLDQKQALAVFNQRMRRMGERRVMVFVHGYNTTFEEAVYRFAQIIHDSGAPVMPVLFTWPSRGRLLAYGYDYESGTISRDALEGLLLALNRDPNVQEISILAHSMGNWVTLEALRQMAIRTGRVAPKINSVMLAAPDVGFDVFRRQIAAIGQKRPPFVIFTSQDDEALAMSQRVWGGSRLGAIDPDTEPYRSLLAREDITVVDLTRLKGTDAFNHGKYTQSQVVQLIGQRLVAGQTLSDSGAGLGDRIGRMAVGAASTVGSAASIAVSAPIAIVDPRTREGLGDQLQVLGASVADTLALPPPRNAGPAPAP
ncbi:alpha/beta hydrolase [Camelimonas abortus]|uniref:Alpha/beta hydrolase n=1 Tax=Camelimonas abortus TaxID=1017184 RepID=A0ABV7LDI0_9HYPH